MPLASPRAFPVAVLAVAIFSAMDAVVKGLVLDIGLYPMLVWRALAALALAAIPFARGGGAWPRGTTLRIHLARGAITVVMAALFFWALARMPMAQAIALSFIAPILALALAAGTLGERVGRRVVGASALALGGVAVIAAGDARAGGAPLLAVGAVLLSALCYAGNIVLMRHQALAAGPAEVAFFQSLTVAVLLVLSVPLMGGVAFPQGLAWPRLVAAAALQTVSLLLFGWAYARAPASRLAASEYSALIWSSLFGWFVFGEHLRNATIAGAVLIVAGCLMAARDRHDEGTMEAQL